MVASGFRSAGKPALAPRRRRGLALCALALAAAGCAGSQKPKEEFVWPLPPDKPRVRHVESFSGPNDFDTRGSTKFRRAILGSDRGLELDNPTGLALSPDDRLLYVSCTGKSFVMVFDRKERTAEPFPFAEGTQPKTPYGIAVDTDGTVFVADSAGGTVRAYTPAGKFLRQIGQGLLERPVGVAIDRRRRVLYVVDGGNRKSTRHLVEAFAPDGRHLLTIGSAGPGPGQFLFPTNVAVAPDGNVYVADTLNSRIQVFDPEGSLVTMFGSLSDAPGGFGKVKGLAFDAFGNLHAVDGQQVYVQIFNARHRPLMAYGGSGARPELMQLPNGIAIDSKNQIFVADFAAKQVKHYELINTTAADSLDDAGGAPQGSAPGAAGSSAAPPAAAPSSGGERPTR